MKHLLSALLLAGALCATPAAAAPATVRLDYFHTGNHETEIFSVDEVVIEPLPWPGNTAWPIDETHRGKYLFEVVDPQSGTTLYSRSFSSIYGEWETTGEARRMNRTYHESLRFPHPGKPVVVVLRKRGAGNAFEEIWRTPVDPDDYMNHRESAMYADQVVAIHESGDPSVKVDLLLLGDGYTAEEQQAFIDKARELTDILLSTSPFRERKDDFNVWAVAPAAMESGVSRPSTDTYRDSPIGARYDAFRSVRYVLTNDNKSLRRIASSAPYDFIEILTNTDVYGGGGIYGLFSTAAANSEWAPYLFVHEFGHHFAGLADEYYTSPVEYLPPGEVVEPYEPNVTALLDPDNLKWKHLVAPNTPLPTPWPKKTYDEYSLAYQERRAKMRAEDAPEAEMNALFDEVLEFTGDLFAGSEYKDATGAFQGANYDAHAYYRSEQNCVMFTRIDDFCQVCSDAIERVIDEYSRVPEPAARVNAIADRYFEHTLATEPESSYFSGIDIDRHDGMFDNSLEALERSNEVIDALLHELNSIDSDALVGRGEWITYAYLEQALQASVDTRVCRRELWGVNQMGGWQLGATAVAQLQPIGNPELRKQALARWAKLPAFVDQEIANLETGLELGYSSAQSVVRRVIAQLDGVLALPVEQSPFYSPALRDEDELFGVAMERLVSNEIYPALRRYREFLENDYLPKARSSLSVTANPDGEQCYEALLRMNTTLARSGREVFELGQKTVAANKAKVIELGQTQYELSDFREIMAAVRDDPTDRFGSAEELLEFSKVAVQRAEAEMPNWVATMPTRAVEVVPFEEHEEGTGRSAHYNAGTQDRPGEYRIPLHQPDKQSRGNAEAVAFHETWPGHHLQIAFSQSMPGLHPVTQIIWFSGPGEGWARYSEALAEEMGLYETKTGPIRRRAWPARGMVVDPGIHLFGWTREQAIEFMLEAGRFPPERADEMVDRIAAIPGQLTAYDSGGLEIFALRAEAEKQLGERFDVREFHDRVLEYGTIPLGPLRTHVAAWLAAKHTTGGP